MVPDIPIRL